MRMSATRQAARGSPADSRKLSASANVAVECHRARRLLCEVEHFLPRAHLALSLPQRRDVMDDAEPAGHDHRGQRQLMGDCADGDGECPLDEERGNRQGDGKAVALQQIRPHALPARASHPSPVDRV